MLYRSKSYISALRRRLKLRLGSCFRAHICTLRPRVAMIALPQGTYQVLALPSFQACSQLEAVASSSSGLARGNTRYLYLSFQPDADLEKARRNSRSGVQIKKTKVSIILLAKTDCFRRPRQAFPTSVARIYGWNRTYSENQRCRRISGARTPQTCLMGSGRDVSQLKKQAKLLGQRPRLIQHMLCTVRNFLQILDALSSSWPRTDVELVLVEYIARSSTLLSSNIFCFCA